MYYLTTDLQKEASQYQPQIVPTIDANFDQLYQDSLKRIIPYVNQMDEQSLAIFIRNNFDAIIKNIKDGNSDCVPLLVNHRFVTAFTKAIITIPINDGTRRVCNKISYDYFTSENPDPMIKSQYLAMSKIINSDIIAKLAALGLNDIISSNLALCRYSSETETTNVKRLNFSIYHRDPNIMTEQMIVWIYEKLFTHISDLFQGTMFEVYTDQQFADFGEDFVENYGTVSLAVLTILNNMTSEDIRKVILKYKANWEYLGCPPVRFSLHALSNDYFRITRVVEYLSNNEGEYIP